MSEFLDRAQSDESSPQQHQEQEKETSCAKTLLGKRRREAHNSDVTAAPDDDQKQLPLAPTLAAFLEQGGFRRFRPRPEWIQAPPPPAPPSPEVAVYRSASPTSYFSGPMFLEAQNHHSHHHQSQSLRRRPTTGNNDNEARLSVLEILSGSLVEDVGSDDPEEQTPGARRTSQSNNNNNATTSEPALLLAIRENATQAALILLEAGAPISTENTKGVSPLVLAAQKGNLTIVQALLDHGANPASVASSGSTALLQAAHFGHRRICQLLLARQQEQAQHVATGGPPLHEMANLNLTTPLMRAAQEGHEGIVKDLLRAGAQVNRRNRCHMSALMLASQRGHGAVCADLIRYGADVDARTNQDSTSLLLACKRAHVQVVEILVTAGCEIHVKDARGRTARDVVTRRQELLAARHHHHHHHRETTETQARLKAMLGLLDSTVQRHLMQCQGRKLRSLEIMLHWKLLQRDRAVVAAPLCDEEREPITLQDIPDLLAHPVCSLLPYPLGLTSTQALLRTMLLPAPLVQLIATFLPLPHLWERTIGMLTRRATMHADETVISALDLMDEILEEGGFVEACDAALVPPPNCFSTWHEWKAFGRKRGQIKSESVTLSSRERPNVTLAVVPNPAKPERPTSVERRRVAGFVSLLQQHASLQRVLRSQPYNMPAGLVSQLARTADLASLVRRMGPLGGVHFDSTVAMDLVMLVSRLCAWYWRHSESLMLPTSYRLLNEPETAAR